MTVDEELQRLRNQFYEGVKDILVRHRSRDGVERTVVAQAFLLSRAKLGDARARDIFAKFGPMTKRQASEHRKLEIVMMYGVMGKPSKAEFARLMAAKNKGKARVERIGSGSDNPDNMLQYVKRVFRQKKYRDVADRWHALQKKNGTF